MRRLFCVGALLAALGGMVPSVEADIWHNRQPGSTLAAVPTAAGPTGSSTTESLPGSLDACQEVNLLFTVDMARVRPLVPPGYRVSAEAKGTATLFIRGFDCRAFVWNGPSRAGSYPIVGTTVMVLVDPPDGTGVVNAYVLFIATNSQEYNELAWHAADPEVKVAHVNNFKIGFPPLSPLISGFTSYAPAPTPWPFEASGTVTEHQGPRDTGGTPFLLNFWHDSAHATMKFAVTVEGLEMAPARVEIRSPGTDLGRMFGMENKATSDEVGSNHARFRRATVVRTIISR